MVINHISWAIDRSTSCIKAVRGVAGVLAAIGRTFSGIHPFNKVLAADKCNNVTNTAPP